MEKHELAIIGAGPAGLTAALYAGRQNLDTVLVSKELGGQITQANSVENFPGLPGISGAKLTKTIKKQVDDYDVKYLEKTVKEITKKKDGFILEIDSHKKNIKSKALIISFGKQPRRLNVPGEKKFVGKGVSYCATCDMPLFHNKKVAIIGGGNSALHAVLAAEKVAEKIYLIHRREKFRAENSLIKQIKPLSETGKLEVLTSSDLKKIEGDKFVNLITVENNKTKDKKELAVDGVFLEIGFVINNDLVKNLVEFEEGEIKVDNKAATKTPGLFVAGDISAAAHDQAIIAAGLGATSAISAYQYLKGEEGKKI